TPDLVPEPLVLPVVPSLPSVRVRPALHRPRRRNNSSSGSDPTRPRPSGPAGPRGSMEVGMRVVRGLDWKWGNQDDSEGHVGTVVEIGRQGSTTTPDKTVVTIWLQLMERVRHSNIICDSCKKHGIMGMRWKCKVCFDYDLCTQCYMNNKHDLGHAFERYETAHSQ
ncbi:unnamed protein product, partial [Coregonus sp. 'balchen']